MLKCGRGVVCQLYRHTFFFTIPNGHSETNTVKDFDRN